MQGPDLTNSLVGVLTRFREDPVAFMGDVEAMFHQVSVPPSQYDYLRFLWWPDGNLEGELQEYRMVVHLFGAVSSPSVANFALKRTTTDNEEQYGTLVAETLRKNFYVDDCLRSVSSEGTAVELIEGLRQSCKKGGFHLTKFTSNRHAVLESIPVDERSKEVKSKLLNVTASLLSAPWGYSGIYNRIVLDFESLLTANRLPDEGSCPLSHQSSTPWVSSPLSHFWQRSCYRISAAINTLTGMMTFRRTTAENGKDGVQNFRC